MLKPLDFILCTLCREDDLLGGRGSRKEKREEGDRIRDAEKRYHWGFFRVSKDALI